MLCRLDLYFSCVRCSPLFPSCVIAVWSLVFFFVLLAFSLCCSILACRCESGRRYRCRTHTWKISNNFFPALTIDQCRKIIIRNFGKPSWAQPEQKRSPNSVTRHQKRATKATPTRKQKENMSKRLKETTGKLSFPSTDLWNDRIKNNKQSKTKPESEETRTDTQQQNKPTEKTRRSVGLRCGGQFWWKSIGSFNYKLFGSRRNAY